jgi:hypothetical protein
MSANIRSHQATDGSFNERRSITEGKNMKATASAFLVFLVLLFLGPTRAGGTDLTLTTSGRVTVELITSEAVFRNTLSLRLPANADIATDPGGGDLTGCHVESFNFGGVELLSEKTSRHGCRVELDADAATAGIQPFASGDTLSFNLCAQTDNNLATCEHVWSSDLTRNTDNKDHVRFTTEQGGNYNLMRWEDLPDLGANGDFDDLIAVVRVAQDSDGDGLWDDWEQSGIDTNGDGTRDFTLPGNPSHLHKDIYVEIDYMDCNIAGGDCVGSDTHDHEPLPAAITEVRNAFAAVPNSLVNNPDGQPGITLHVDATQGIPHSNILQFDCGSTTPCTDFDDVKNNPSNFGPDNPRRFAYHYILFTHQLAASSSTSGQAESPGNDVIVSLGGPNWTGLPAAQTQRVHAGTLMHELGHNLGLRHGGDVCTNHKPNYLSIMNYAFQFNGILPAAGGLGPLDYSRQDLPDLVESGLNEPVGIQDGAGNLTEHRCSNGSRRLGAGNGYINWNCDTDDTTSGKADLNVNANVNYDCTDSVTTPGSNVCGACPTSCECDPGETPIVGVLTGYSDWENLKYDFQNTGDFEDGVHLDVVGPEMDYETYLLHVNQPPSCDADGPYTAECQGAHTEVALDGTGSTDPENEAISYAWSTDCPAGSFDDSSSPSPAVTIDSSAQSLQCYVSLDVTDSANNSDGCSSSVAISDTVAPSLACPPDASVECDESTDPSNAGSASATDACDPSVSVGFSDAIVPGLCPQESIITRTWTATDASGNASTCAQTVEVVDTTAPIIECNASPTSVPPDAPISFTVTATDNCDDQVSAEIIEFDCFKYTKKGKRIDKTESCVVEIANDTITIADTGGVGAHITWTARSSDDCGNIGRTVCEVEIVNPVQP